MKDIETQACFMAAHALDIPKLSKQAVVYVSMGGGLEGVAYGEEVFLNAPHLLSLTEYEICGVIAHELIHVELGFPKPDKTIKSFVRLVMEEGFAVRAQLNFPESTYNYSKWEDYMNSENLKKHIDNIETDVKMKDVKALSKDYLDGFGPGYAVGFAMIDSVTNSALPRCEFSKLNLIQLGNAIKEKPFEIWNQLIERARTYNWSNRKKLLANSM